MPENSDLQDAACVLTVLADMATDAELAERLRFLAFGLVPDDVDSGWHQLALREWNKDLTYAFRANS